MNHLNQASTEQLSYETFICYFEKEYLFVLSGYKLYEQRAQFLENIKKVALKHKHFYELQYGKGSYYANLAKYGSLNRTPLQIIEGDVNCTHLLMPKVSHTYLTGLRTGSMIRNKHWNTAA